MAANQPKYVIRKKDPAQIAAEKKLAQRGIGEWLLAQWAGFVGAAFFLGGIGYYWYVKVTPPHILYLAPLGTLFLVGIALLAYWALVS